MVIQAAALLPIAPLLLLPFIVAFFIIVFPIWLVAMIALAIVRGMVRLLVRRSDHPAVASLNRAFNWVKSFGGLIQLGGERLKQ